MYIVPMEAVIGALGGFRGVRAELLVALKKAQPITAPELGQQFGLTANALRRHLKVLEEEGLVSFAREVRGVGAPVYTFSLTAAGEATFDGVASYIEIPQSPRLGLGTGDFAIAAWVMTDLLTDA